MALAGDHVQVLVDGYELTGDSNKIMPDDRRDLLEKTAFGDAAHHFLPGQVLNRLAHEGFLNADAAPGAGEGEPGFGAPLGDVHRRRSLPGGRLFHHEHVQRADGR